MSEEDQILSYLNEIEQLPPDTVGALWLAIGCILAQDYRKQVAELIASAVLRSTYGSEEDKQHFLAFAQSFAMAAETLNRAVVPQNWTGNVDVD